MNVAETGGDHRPKPIGSEGKHCPFAGRATAEVNISNDDLCLSIGFLIENELRLFIPITIKPKIMKQLRCIVRVTPRLSQIPRRDDLIRVDVYPVEGHGNR